MSDEERGLIVVPSQEDPLPKLITALEGFKKQLQEIYDDIEQRDRVWGDTTHKVKNIFHETALWYETYLEADIQLTWPSNHLTIGELSVVELAPLKRDVIAIGKGFDHVPDTEAGYRKHGQSIIELQKIIRKVIKRITRAWEILDNLTDEE